MVTEVDVWTLSAAVADGAYVVDVREPYEYVAGHVPGAHLVPLSTIAQSVDDLPRNRPIYVICQGGNRSMIAARTLSNLGREAWSVTGGTSGWIGAGQPVVRGPRQNRA